MLPLSLRFRKAASGYDLQKTKLDIKIAEGHKQACRTLAGGQNYDSVVGVSSAYSNVGKAPKKVPSYMSIIMFKAGHS